MTTTTQQLIESNDALRAEYPDAIIIDSVLGSDGFRLTVIPRNARQDHQTGKGPTIQAALEDLRAKFAAADPVANIRKDAEKLGYGLVKLPQD